MTSPDGPRQQARRNTRARFEQWTKNPTCHANTLSAVHNVRLDKAAERVGLRTTFGQSPFAIARGNRFETGLFRDDAERLRAALEKKGHLAKSSSGFLDLRLRMNGGARLASVDAALAATGAWLVRIAADPASAEPIVAAPMIRIPKGVILPEALLIIDVVTVTAGVAGRCRLNVGEVKVFADRGGHTDPQQLAAARAQAGIYHHAFQLTLESLGYVDQIELAPDGFLVFTWPGSNSPSVRLGEDLRYQSIRASRGFKRLEEVATEIVRDDDFAADDPALIDRVLDAPTDYAESCLSFCDLAPRCHQRAVDSSDAVVLGDDAQSFLGNTSVTRAVELLNGAEPQDERELDLQRQLGCA